MSDDFNERLREFQVTVRELAARRQDATICAQQEAFRIAQAYWAEYRFPVHDCGDPTGMPPLYRGYDEIVPVPVVTEATIIPFPIERTRRPKGEHWFAP